MNHFDLAYWLLRNSGASIRYRTLRDLIHERDVGVVAEALDEILGCPAVQRWLENLIPDFSMNGIHSGNPHAYENVMGKLSHLGLHAGLQPFDNKTLPFRVWLSENISLPPKKPYDMFLRTIVASFLAFAGYGTVQAVQNHLLGRLSSIFEFAKSPDYDSIYITKPDFTNTSRQRYLETHGFVNPELYPEQHFRLPWIHDLRGIVSLECIMQNPSRRYMIERIGEMILSDEYQSLPWSYGLARYGKKYYVIGWGMRLPGLSTLPKEREFAEMLLVMDLLAPLDCIQSSDWFRRSLEYIESFQTADGTYLFPRTWLPERKRGYWVGGEYMAFDDRTRRNTAIECESTFWVLRINQRANTHNRV